MTENIADAAKGPADLAAGTDGQGIIALLGKVLGNSGSSDEKALVRKALESILEDPAPKAETRKGGKTSEKTAAAEAFFSHDVRIIAIIVSIFTGFIVLFLNTAFNNLENRMSGLETRVNVGIAQLDARMDRLDARMERLESKMDDMAKEISRVWMAIGRLEGSVNVLLAAGTGRQPPRVPDDAESGGIPGQSAPEAAGQAAAPPE
ncbi:MAG: hypothetical protein LBQ12_03145 [Deltaproteobacteria bacterium]|nr:hypothetical protein [Deltaproteobacteria bacterium]